MHAPLQTPLAWSKHACVKHVLHYLESSVSTPKIVLAPLSTHACKHRHMYTSTLVPYASFRLETNARAQFLKKHNMHKGAALTLERIGGREREGTLLHGAASSSKHHSSPKKRCRPFSLLQESSAHQSYMLLFCVY